MDNEGDCKCVKIIGHLEAVKWLLWPREYRPSPGPLSLGDWTKDPFIWLHHVESSDGLLREHPVLVSTDSRYWSIHDVQRYFVGELHCEQLLFTFEHPNLRMPTRLGSYFWKANNASKVPTKLHQKELHRSFEITLKKMEEEQCQMDRMIISDQLVKIGRLDYFKRKTFFRILQNILSFQDRLQLLSLENLCCDRLEGVRLVQQLACFNSHSLKYLFLWRFCLPNQNPILINYSYITGSGQYISRPDTKECFLRSLAALSNLRVLALEYSHIADGTGNAIVALLPILKRPHFRLQLLCREDQTPGRVDAALGEGGHGIPDTAWRRIAIACPDLYLLMAFFRVRDYDKALRFLTPSLPLRETHLQYGIDLKTTQRQDSDVHCFIRHVAHCYGNSLVGYLSTVTLSIHQWRFSTFPLHRVFELMPRLVRLFYVGRVEDEVELKRMLQIAACGVCDKLKQITIQIQDEESKRPYWQQVAKDVTEEYSDILALFDIKLCLDIYKS